MGCGPVPLPKLLEGLRRARASRGRAPGARAVLDGWGCAPWGWLARRGRPEEPS